MLNCSMNFRVFLEKGIDNLTKSIGDLSEEMSTRVNTHIVQTRKELDKQGQ